MHATPVVFFVLEWFKIHEQHAPLQQRSQHQFVQMPVYVIMSSFEIDFWLIEHRLNLLSASK